MNENGKLKRGLKNRHLQMIALGGAIGTGLFYGSASTIALAGPAVMLAYLIGGIMIFFIMRMLGEMAVDEPVSGSFSHYATKYWGKFPGFMSGWNYWFNYVLVSMAELTAVGIYMQFWFPDLPQWIAALICLVAITALNLINVRLYGETEFWMALIKITAIVLMIVLGVYILLGSPQPFPDNLSNLWSYGGFLPNGVWGLALAIAVVMFSFGGIELIGITAGEAENPDKTIPTAINQVIWRILIFYVGTMAVLMALWPPISQTFNLNPSLHIVFTLKPFVGSSIFDGESLLKNFRRVVLPALSKPKTNILASLSDFFNLRKRSSNPIFLINILIFLFLI